ncbi:VWA domain-containing protein [Photobacterium frigidiphilum]|uniref:vWA domain-containing protein n=1 Tax=Photobacterium frigidiphilum TaxID=264736 RepID=UPI003D0C6792
MFDSLLWQQAWQQFHFIRPYWLLVLIPLCVVVYLRWKQEADEQWQQFLPSHLRQVLTIGETSWKKHLPLKLLTVSMVLAILVCAGPSWQREASPFGEDKSSLLVVLDNSDSMLLQDIAPSRLERAKQKIRDLMALRQGGRTGLVVYSGSAHIAMPLTQDSDVFTPFLAAIEPDIMPVEGKSAETILPLLTQQLGTETVGTVLLLTDGVNPNTIEQFEAYFAESPHQLLILAVGNTALKTGSPLDLTSLRQLASVTGGKVLELTVDDGDITTLNRQIERYMQLNNESAMPWKDMGYYLLIPIAFMLLLWFRKGWLVQWCVLAAVSLSVSYSPYTAAQPVMSKAETVVQEVTIGETLNQWWMNLWLTPDQQGQFYFNHGDYLQAAIHYTDSFRKGVAYYYAAEYQFARSAFMQDGSEIAMLNAGNALARQREYLAARDLFRQLSKTADSSSVRQQAKHNWEAIQSIVDEINRTSESQMGTTDGPEDSFELADDQPRTSDGAEEKVDASMMVRETLNANEILGSSELADKWLRRVEADPKYFLRAKFLIQLHSQPNVLLNDDKLAGKGQKKEAPLSGSHITGEHNE